MALSLYEVTVPAFAQIMEAMAGVLKKGEAHAIEKGMRPDDWVGARLFADMAPLSFQVKQAAHHSVGAIEATKNGVFSPDLTPPPETFADLQATLAHVLAGGRNLQQVAENAKAGEMNLEPADLARIRGDVIALGLEHMRAVERVGDEAAADIADQRRRHRRDVEKLHERDQQAVMRRDGRQPDDEKGGELQVQAQR